ncbi:MAG: V-type ATP synthase subunit D [Candidatus Methanomethylophilaceae archaeon]|nr:V-type ATP synthase subunit D [Candidatus Methanomethylophilaceae archaeon]
MVSQDITPTRSVLIELKNKIKTTKNGYKIMKMKRDGLIIEFFDIMEKAKAMRGSVTSDYETAMTKIAIASSVEGEIAVKSAAYALKTEPKVKVGSKSIMGMMVPKVEAEVIHADITNKGYGVISTSAYIEEASTAFEKLLDTIIRAAEIETTMKKLLDEIEKTKRRVNAMEFKVIPELEDAMKFVKFRLEEMDRENTIRLKFLKGKGEAAE